MTTEASSSFQTHLSTDAAVASSPEFVAQCNVTDYEPLYQRSIADVEAYWEEQAKQFEWFAPWTKVRQIDYPYARWFVGGKCKYHSQLPRPPRERRAQKQGGVNLAERGRQGAHLHLRDAAPARATGGERAQGTRRRQGRSCLHLHAAYSRRHHRDARLRPYRRHSLGDLCGAWPHRVAQPH